MSETSVISGSDLGSENQRTHEAADRATPSEITSEPEENTSKSQSETSSKSVATSQTLTDSAVAKDISLNISSIKNASSWSMVRHNQLDDSGIESPHSGCRPLDQVAVLKLTTPNDPINCLPHITSPAPSKPSTAMDIDTSEKNSAYGSMDQTEVGPEEDKSPMHKIEASTILEDGVMCKLKKDDSGISVRESLTSDDSKCDDTSRDDRPSVSTESEGLVADLDTEDSEPTGHDKAAAATAKSDTSDDDDDDDDDDTEERQQARRLKILLKRDSSSSSSTSSGPDEDIEAASPDSKSDKSDEEEEMEIDADMPKDTWSAMSQLHMRENGLPNRLPVDRMFRRHTMSSLRMVQRLKLQHKMTRHEGCVNALNFNKSGMLSDPYSSTTDSLIHVYRGQTSMGSSGSRSSCTLTNISHFFSFSLF